MRSFLRLSTLATLTAAALTGCSPYDPDLGGTPFLCAADEPRCPDDYTCQDDGTSRMVCVSANGSIVDSGPIGFQCADDSQLETSNGASNDTIQTAYITPVAGQRKDISFAGVAICPEGDKDTYQVTTTAANQNLEAVTTWETGMPVSVSILGSGGATLNNGTSSGEKSLRAYVANLPIGTYFVQTYASATVKNNYRIEIKVDP